MDGIPSSPSSPLPARPEKKCTFAVYIWAWWIFASASNAVFALFPPVSCPASRVSRRSDGSILEAHLSLAAPMEWRRAI